MSVSLWSDAHQGFIYSLSWSHDSHMISTASADGIVKYVSRKRVFFMTITMQ